jgi:hypothetical protein
MAKKKKQVDPRHVVFKDMLFRCFRFLNNGMNPPWDGSDAKQLDLTLKANPELTADQFYRCLVYYSDSHNIIPGARPRKFLPNISEYANGPLDKYNRPLVEKKRRVL